MGILHRHILAELVRVFLVALVALSTIFVVVGVYQEATQQGLNPLEALLLVPFVIPASLPYSIPATVLLAVTVVYGRMAADNEIMAAKSAGINVLYLTVPALALGFVLSCLSYYLHDRVIPAANLRMRSVFLRNVEDAVYAVLKRDGVIKVSRMPYEIYAEEVRGKKLINAHFKRRNAGGVYDLVVFAREAELRFDLEAKVVNVHMYKAVVTGADKIRLETSDNVFPIALPNLVNVTPRIRDMTMRQIAEQKVALGLAERRACSVWATKTSMAVATGTLDRIHWASLVELTDQRRQLQRDLWRMNCEPHMRGAISFGCLSFVLLGCPVAILFQRGDYLSAFISCFLPIILVYYPLVMFGFNLSKEGIAPPQILWGVDLLLAALSILPFWPVLRH